MSLSINSPDIEARVMREAVIRGMTPADFAARILDDNLPALREGLANSQPLPQPETNTSERPLSGPLSAAAQAYVPLNGQDGFYDSTLALFDAWALEDATDDPEELARIQREGDELLANLAKNRLKFHEVVLDLDAYD